MNKYRKKPVVIEAMQFDGTIVSASAIAQWANDPLQDGVWFDYCSHDGDMVNAYDVMTHTMEGPLGVSKGDFVIRGVKGEFYPCKPDIFEATYDIEPEALPAEDLCKPKED